MTLGFESQTADKHGLAQNVTGLDTEMLIDSS